MNPITLTVAVALVALAGCKHSNEPTSMSSKTMSSNPAAKAASTQPSRVLGLEPGWELAPQAKYLAVQKGGEVVVTARGENPTAGFENKLFMSPLRIWPPQWMLAQKKPDGVVAQVITPFEVKASFKASEPVKFVKVTDAAGGHTIPVTREGE